MIYYGAGDGDKIALPTLPFATQKVEPSSAAEPQPIKENLEVQSEEATSYYGRIGIRVLLSLRNPPHRKLAILDKKSFGRVVEIIYPDLQPGNNEKDRK